MRRHYPKLHDIYTHAHVHAYTSLLIWGSQGPNSLKILVDKSNLMEDSHGYSSVADNQLLQFITQAVASELCHAVCKIW